MRNRNAESGRRQAAVISGASAGSEPLKSTSIAGCSSNSCGMRTAMVTLVLNAISAFTCRRMARASVRLIHQNRGTLIASALSFRSRRTGRDPRPSANIAAYAAIARAEFS